MPSNIPYRWEKDNIVKNKHLTDARMLGNIFCIEIPQGISVFPSNGPIKVNTRFQILTKIEVK